MKRRISILLVLTLLILAAVPMAVSAEETEYDWDSVDWSEFDASIFYFDHELKASYDHWIRYEASFEKLFERGMYADGASATSFSSVIKERFYGAPEALLIALSQAETDVQHQMLDLLLYEIDIPSISEKFVATLENIRLNGETNPEAVRLMLILIEEAQLRLGVSITAPPTGDPVSAAALALLLSGTVITLVRKKR